MKYRNYLKQLEYGRSMVEMLGVLAVIGVLSFGGIQGYKYAMDKHRANDIVHEVNMRVQDIWHTYQDKPFPTEFSEWPEMTQTGFPIDIVPNPNNITFSVDVENVPNGVCKQVVNEGLNDSLVKMIRIVPNDPDSDAGVIYNGDVSVCEEYGDVSGMRFLATLESLNGEQGGKKPTDKNGDETTYCYEKSDCASVGGSSCFDCINNLCQPDCPSGKPYCNTENTTTPTCERCLNNSHCPKGYICDELNHSCIEFKEQCEANEFRTANGACMPCTTYSNIQVSDEPFEFKVDDRVLYREDVSGVDMCQQRCSDEGKFITEVKNEENGTSTKYCAYSCVDGYSYQANGGCIKCSDKTNAVIPNGVEKAKEQCVACGGTWVQDKTSNVLICMMKECAEDEFYESTASGPKCIKYSVANGSDFRAYWTLAAGSSSDGQFFEKVKTACNREGSHRKYLLTSSGTALCVPDCTTGEQIRDANWGYCRPCNYAGNLYGSTHYYSDIPALCRACDRIHANGTCYALCTKGQRWRDKSYNCIECNSITTATETINNSDYEDLCTACNNREFVVENGVAHCKLKARECNADEFKNINGQCVPCNADETEDVIKVNNISDCNSKCTGENGITRREANANSDGVLWCVKSWGTGNFTHLRGLKVSCSNTTWDASSIGTSQLGMELCLACGNRIPQKTATTYYSCELNSCPKNYFLSPAASMCLDCNSNANSRLTHETLKNNDSYDRIKESCLACGNREVKTINGVEYCVRTTCNANQFIDSSNNCQNCSNAGVYTINTINPEYAELCTACGNRFVLGDKCIRYSYGNYGICNNHNNGNASGYSAGEGKKLRTIENNYSCGDCTKDTAFNVGNDAVGREQCASCGGNRQFVNGRCLLGHCTPPNDFMTLDGCVKCSFITGRYEIAKEDSLECKQCGDDKFVQQVGKEDDAKYYCVSKPLGRNYLKADGQEIPCDWNSEEEIGFDTTSEELCRQCGKYPFNGVCYLSPVNPV